jgi:hypothetical protein
MRFIATIIFTLLSTHIAYAQTPPIRQSLSVEEAYRSIPHKQTTFDAKTMKDKKIAAYLQQLFTLVDTSVTERVMWQQALRQGRAPAYNNYSVILQQINALNVPDDLNDVQKLIGDAVAEQYAYLKSLQDQGATSIRPDDKKIGEISQRLRQAYGLLMQRYPNETPHNKAAFFDHLCALDFI